MLRVAAHRLQPMVSMRNDTIFSFQTIVLFLIDTLLSIFLLLNIILALKGETTISKNAIIIDAKSNGNLSTNSTIGNGGKANVTNTTTTKKPSTPKGTLLHILFKRWQIEYEYY